MAPDLQLRVLLDIKDKLLAPLRKNKDAASALGKTLKETRESLKGLEASQSVISKFRALGDESQQLADKLTAAKQRLRDVGMQMNAASYPGEKLTNEFKAAAAEVKKLESSQKKHNATLETARQKLHAAGFSAKTMAAEEQKLKSSIASANSAIAEQKGKLEKLNAIQARSQAISARHAKTMLHAGMAQAAGYSMLSAGRAGVNATLAPVKAAMSYEDAMLGVARQVNGARDANGNLTKTYYEMGESILQMSKRIPMAATEIAALVEAGARMGIQGKENLLSFAETTAITATAFDLPVDEVGDNMGKIAGLYKIPISSMRELGDTINWLDDNALSKGGDIIEVMQRMGGIATSAGMDFKEAAALGSTFLSLGASAKVAGTASNAMIRELSIANMQPDKFQDGMKMIGMSSKQVQAEMAEDATGTIIKVLEAIKKLDKETQLTAATQLFGKEYGDDASKLANNLDEYRRQLALVNDAQAKNSMQREADAKNQALSSQWIMTQSRQFEAMKRAGDSLRPTLIELMKTSSGWLENISEFIKENPNFTAGMMKAGIIVAGLLVVLGGAAVGIGSLIMPFSLVTMALSKLVLHGPAAVSALKMVGSAMLLNPIGLAITAIGLLAVAGYMLWKNWDGVVGGLKAIWQDLGGSIGAVIGNISAFLVNWSPLGLMYKGFAALLSYLGIELPGSLTALGSQLITSLINGIKNSLPALGTAWDWVKAKVGIGTSAAVIGAAAAMPVAAGVSIGNTAPIIAPAARASSQQAAGAPVNINVHPAPGMNEQQLAQAVAQQLEAQKRKDAASQRSRLSDKE